ncbi:DsrE family protein [Glaciecola sp. 2405UD65-10]|uniref:DsrE family protein n=1 Tax=Glaciecola sp. 2405UD65-10 TaxID=3397244 RepID=UPI003B5955C6
MKQLLASSVLLCCLSTTSFAQMSTFKAGTVITEFGKYADVPSSSVGIDSSFKVAFDAVSAADDGKVNRKFDSLARFINMHVAAGVKKENISLALVVHGKAIFDLMNNDAYKNKKGTENANIPLLEALMENNVRVILCGQSAAANAVELKHLVEGVEIELSAMTAHALLQQQGYTSNPF